MLVVPNCDNFLMVSFSLNMWMVCEDRNCKRLGLKFKIYTLKISFSMYILPVHMSDQFLSAG